MDKTLLQQKWVRAYEEDTDDEIVFRSSSNELKPRRGGRESIHLKDDNVFLHRQSGPDDKYLSAEGSWQLQGDKISFQGANLPLGLGEHSIVFFTPDKLILKK